MSSVFLALILTLFALPVFAQEFPSKPQELARGRILVKFKESTPQDVIDLNLGKYNARLAARINRLNVMVLNVPMFQEEAIISAFSKIPNVL